MTKTKTNKRLFFLLLAILVAGLIVGWRLEGQTTTAKPAATTAPTPAPPLAPTSTTVYALTELQKAHLHEAQLQYVIASRDFQKAVDDFTRACETVKAENKWPHQTQCNIQDLSIVPPPK